MYNSVTSFKKEKRKIKNGGGGWGARLIARSSFPALDKPSFLLSLNGCLKIIL